MNSNDTPAFSKPFKCPVCSGTGIVSKPPWVAGDVPQWADAATSHACHACRGTGVLWRYDVVEWKEWG